VKEIETQTEYQGGHTLFFLARKEAILNNQLLLQLAESIFIHHPLKVFLRILDVPDIHGRRQLEFSRIGEGDVNTVMPKHKDGTTEYGSEEDGLEEREGYVFQLLMIQHSKVAFSFSFFFCFLCFLFLVALLLLYAPVFSTASSNI
jgi:hypothetical protein